MKYRLKIMCLCLLAGASLAGFVPAQERPFNPGLFDEPQQAQHGDEIPRPGRVVNADFNQFADERPTRPANQQAAARNELGGKIPLQRPAGNPATPGKATTGSANSVTTTVVALFVVVVLIFGVAKLLGRRESALRGGFAAEAFDVLSRRAIDARNSLVLVRVGDKLVVVGLSQSGMHTLSEITDQAEVERLTNLSKATEPLRRFGWLSWFRGFGSSKSETPSGSSRHSQEQIGASLATSANRLPSSTHQVGRNFPSGLSVRELEEGGHV